jgi:hypothetical protein
MNYHVKLIRWLRGRKMVLEKHRCTRLYTLCSVVALQSNFCLPTQKNFDNSKYPERTLRFEDALTTLNKREQYRQKHHTAKHVKFCCTKRNAISMHETALQYHLSSHCFARQCKMCDIHTLFANRLFTGKKNTEYVLVCRNKICCA